MTSLPERDFARSMSPTIEPARAITRYCRKDQLKNHPMQPIRGTHSNASGAYDDTALIPAMNMMTSHLSLRLSLVNIHSSPPHIAMLARIIMMMSLFHLLRATPKKSVRIYAITTSMNMPALLTSLPFFSSGILTSDMNITPQRRMLNICTIHCGLVLCPVMYALPRTMAKIVRVSHLLKREPVTSHLLTPFSNLLRMARGKAAPIVKRKNGNTRSTQVMPGTSGLNAYVGGGVWQWNIHAGSSE